MTVLKNLNEVYPEEGITGKDILNACQIPVRVIGTKP